MGGGGFPMPMFKGEFDKVYKRQPKSDNGLMKMINFPQKLWFSQNVDHSPSISEHFFVNFHSEMQKKQELRVCWQKTSTARMENSRRKLYKYVQKPQYWNLLEWFARFVVEILISIRPSASALIGVRRRQTGAGCSRWPEITNIDPQRIPTVPNGVPRGAVAVLTLSRRIGSDRTKVALISSSKSYSTFRGSYTRSNCTHRNEPKASNITHILIKITNQKHQNWALHRPEEVD